MGAASQSTKTATVFFSCPGDLGTEKSLLAGVVTEMSPAFFRHGIALVPWTFEGNAKPAAVPSDGSVQTVIDQQMPRKPDGSMDFDLFVGLMDRRIGTALKDAPSGTVHEFLEAKQAFENYGKPHILFYFRDRGQYDGPPDPQIEGVVNFRKQYPGLFASYTSTEDLESQFRRHLLMELLDLLGSGDVNEPDPTAPEWWDEVSARYGAIAGSYAAGFLDRTAGRVRRVLRQLHLLFGIERTLQPRERRILGSALFSLLLHPEDRERFEAAGEVRDVVARSLDDSKLTVRPVGSLRLDLLGALAAIGPRLDLQRSAIAQGAAGPSTADEWLALLTEEIVCERGIVRFHLLAPTAAWAEPLIGATAVAMESLWQRVRTVLTRYGLSFAVARSRVETDADVGPAPPEALDLIARRAAEAVQSLPVYPHFGEAELPAIEALLPLPFSKVAAPVCFRAPLAGPARLLVGGSIVAQAPELGYVEYFPPTGSPSECVLECDEAGEFLPVIASTLERLDPVEAAILDSARDRTAALRSLGLWNDLLEAIWPGVSGPQPGREDLLTAFHILRNAFEEMRLANGSLLARRDTYWDAMEIVRKRLAEPGG